MELISNYKGDYNDDNDNEDDKHDIASLAQCDTNHILGHKHVVVKAGPSECATNLLSVK